MLFTRAEHTAVHIYLIDKGLEKHVCHRKNVSNDDRVRSLLSNVESRNIYIIAIIFELKIFVFTFPGTVGFDRVCFVSV